MKQPPTTFERKAAVIICITTVFFTLGAMVFGH